MDVHAFNSLPKQVRTALVWQHGQYIALRLDSGFSVVLYDMYHFFAEEWYLPEDNSITLVHGFKSTKILDHYLALIDIEDLMK